MYLLTPLNNSNIHNINEFNANVFHNPASEMINVQFDNKSNEKVMIMVDITGKIIESRYRTTQFEIQVDDLKSGNYIICYDQRTKDFG